VVSPLERKHLGREKQQQILALGPLECTSADRGRDGDPSRARRRALELQRTAHTFESTYGDSSSLGRARGSCAGNPIAKMWASVVSRTLSSGIRPSSRIQARLNDAAKVTVRMNRIVSVVSPECGTPVKPQLGKKLFPRNIFLTFCRRRRIIRRTETAFAGQADSPLWVGGEAGEDGCWKTAPS
jgi:hypothetical protein